MRFFCSILLLLLPGVTTLSVSAQTVSQKVPKEIDPDGTYLFYLHGGVVQQQGVDAVSSYYGRYEYLAILDTLSNYGYRLISEARPKETLETDYARKVATQIDTLLRSGVPPEKIVVVGASQGAYIAIETAFIVQNSRVKYALLGLCSEYAIGYFLDSGKPMTGNFFSVFESSDSKGSCNRIFKSIPEGSHYRELQLEMGIDHAFLFKPYKEWVEPLVEWINNRP